MLSFRVYFRLLCPMFCPWLPNMHDTIFLSSSEVSVLDGCMFFALYFVKHTRVYSKVSGLSHNEINNNNKHSLRSSTKGCGGKTHQSDSQNSDTTTPSGRQLYHLLFSLQEASPETFGYTLIYVSYAAQKGRTGLPQTL